MTDTRTHWSEYDRPSDSEDSDSASLSSLVMDELWRDSMGSSSKNPVGLSTTESQETEETRRESNSANAVPSETNEPSKDTADTVPAKEKPLLESIPYIPPVSETPWNREQLKQAGIDPDKVDVTIGVFEPHAEDAAQHDVHVAAIIADPVDGLSRNAPIELIQPEISVLNLPDYSQRENPLQDYISDWASQGLADMASEVRKHCIDEKPDGMRVFNMSFGAEKTMLYEDILTEFEKNPEALRPQIEELIGAEKADNWIKHIEAKVEKRKELQGKFGDTGELPIQGISHGVPETKELLQAIVDKVDSVLEDDPKFADAMKDYQNATKEATDNGVVIVVAAANDGTFAEYHGVEISQGAEYNWYAMSDHVISVGATDIGHTPGERGDDTLTDFSSRGTERYHPTVLAQGEQIPLRSARFGHVSGTSFSAPQVSTAVALMLTQNPELSFDDVQGMLTRNSTPIAGLSQREQGAGILDITRAVVEARDSKKG